MKKKLALLLACLLVCAAVCSSCSMKFSGTAGKSAYEIAVDHGFSGDEEAWLRSLKGQDGMAGNVALPSASFTVEEWFEAAKKYGYPGDFSDFMQEYFRDGGDGDGMEDIIAESILSCVNVTSKFVCTRYQLVGFGGYRAYDQEYASMGSGVIFRMDKARGNAYIITNYHVVYDADSKTESGVSDDIRVFLYGESSADGGIPATFVGGSMYYDIAVLRVSDSEVLKASAAHAAVFADSDDITVGNRAVAIGNPEAEGLSATSGIVSVDSEYITLLAADEQSTIQMRVVRVDTPINSGNSGGGLFNAEGKLIGIVNAKYNSSSVDNIGYAIPSNIARYVAENILENDTGDGSTGITRCLLGVTITSSESHAEYDKDAQRTCIVETVTVSGTEKESLASRYLEEGDVICSVTVNGETVEITRRFVFVDLMLRCRVGDELTVSYLRNGEAGSATFTLTESDVTEIP